MGRPESNTGRTVRVIVALLAAASFVIGGALTAGYLAVRQLVTTTAVGYAKALGIALSPREVRFGPSFVQLLDSNFVVIDVPAVRGNVRRIDIDLSGMRPSQVTFSDIAVSARGNPLELRDSMLQYWARVRLKSARSSEALPRLEWQRLAVNLATDNALVPNVAVTDVSVATNGGPSHDETVIRTASARAGLFDLGPLEIALRHESGLFELGWGPSLHESKWRVTYRDLPNADQLRFSLQPESMKKLLETVGAATIPDALTRATLGGHIEAIRDRASGKATGSFRMELTGFEPPLPPELKGYRFADKTSIIAQFDVDPLWFAMELRGIEMRNGEISLTGHGRIDRALYSLRLRAELATTLDCVTLARGYAHDELGGDLGKWSARNAPKAVRGSVGVRIQVDADSSRLAEAKLVKRIGVGCGLRPMSPIDLLNLGLPPLPDQRTIDRVLQRMAKGELGADLGAMPNLFPTLGEVLEAGKLGNRGSASKSPTKPTSPAKPSIKKPTGPSIEH